MREGTPCWERWSSFGNWSRLGVECAATQRWKVKLSSLVFSCSPPTHSLTYLLVIELSIFKIWENDEIAAKEWFLPEICSHLTVDCVTSCAQCNIYFPSSFRLCRFKLIGEKWSSAQWSWSSVQHSQSQRNMSNVNKQKAATTQSYQSMCVFYRVSLSQGPSGTTTQTGARSASVWMWVWVCVCLSGLIHSVKSVLGVTSSLLLPGHLSKVNNESN